MSARPYHKRYHSDALAGFMSLTLEERGAYQTLLDLMYDRQGPLLDNERLFAGYMGVSIRKWRALREALIAKDKIEVNLDGNLTNSRVEKELENDAKTSRKHAENGSKGGRNKAENEKKDKENSEGCLATLKPDDSHIRVIVREEKKEEERKVMPDTSGAYAFLGRAIKLSPQHLREWRKLFPTILDLSAELSMIDDWWQQEPQSAKRDNWFLATKGMLNKKHQRNLRELSEDDEVEASRAMLS